MTNKLIEDNMKLVYYIVSKEYPTFLHDEDIIQSGMLGLCKAAQHWDSTKSKFSTYAGKCIRNEINNEFIQRKPLSKTVSLETKIGEDGTLADILVGDEDVDFVDEDNLYDQLSKRELEILDLVRRGYSTDEIALYTGLSVQKVRQTVRLIKLKWRSMDEYSY